jgi:hypothetical protein
MLTEKYCHLGTREEIETMFCYGRLHLTDRLTRRTLALRIYNGRLAEGKFADLPKWDAEDALKAQKALTLELEDGRTGSVFITDLQGSFILSGPLA